MKKFTNLALAGAIAMGGLGVTSVADLPGLSTPAAEAAYMQDDYQGVSWKMVENNMDNYVDTKPSYKTGDTFNFTYSDGGTMRYQPTHVKIYKILDNGNLHRLKTIYPTHQSGGGEYWEQYYDFSTPITSVYGAGNYVAVHTYNWEYPDGPDSVVKQQDRSIIFTINK